MTDQQRTEEPLQKLDNDTATTPKLPPACNADVPPVREPATSKKLTEDEQMALYEKELKENDWGHQPC
jgi:hypothetical protein